MRLQKGQLLEYKLSSYLFFFIMLANGRVHVCEADSEEIFRPAGRRKSKRESAVGKPPKPAMQYAHCYSAFLSLFLVNFVKL
ncbi:hypothetical protein SAMN05444274_1306 [Mariniphaga anaerophila]|uniref:Uncharacterized protein n=1 Tax=Mariniphaga anaerophila TaxID=1484053 RepID=A0A1M5GQJ6_9BACT|nr:hypothetical protein SAMN05444274_1306 [Mariniphaga anaerophila]